MFCRAAEKVAADIFRHVRATGQVDVEEATRQPGPVENQIETERKRGGYTGDRLGRPNLT